MMPRASHGDRPPPLFAAAAASRLEVVFARMLSLAGLLVFSSVPLWAVSEHQRMIKDGPMWIKVLGLLCAGVFVGAALVEAKQMLRRKKARKDGESDGEEAAAEAEAEPATSDAGR